MAAKEEKNITNIEPDVVFKGVFNFTENLLVKGRLEGVVKGEKGDILVEESGSIEGQLLARTVDNHGLIKGTAQVLETYTLFAPGKTEAELKVKHIMIEKGAHFNGTCKMES